MTQTRVTFIGAGNMAMSLASGLCAGQTPPVITVADPMQAQLDAYANLPITTETDNQQAVTDADVVVLAVKPQIAGKVFSNLSLAPNQLLISIAAGIPLSALATWTAPDQPIVRCMPNTPALLGAGMSALFANEFCSQQQRQQAEAILMAAGKTLWVEQETELDAVTAVSGSGPAYFFQLMESMIEAGVELGLSQATATQLTLQTAYGAALMANQTSDSPATLRANVTSPGGTTQAALEYMHAQGLPQIIRTALARAAQRSEQLAAEFSPRKSSD
ncbi:MAG: pyrroline-5-carboxylate reductase [Pseudomonadales bacterium]